MEKFENMKPHGAKPKLAIIPPYVKAQLALALEVGNIKYEPGDYLNGGSQTEYLSAAERHIDAIKAGEILDPETAVLHAALAMADLAIYIEMHQHGIGADLIKGFTHPSEAKTPEIAAAFDRLRAAKEKDDIVTGKADDEDDASK